MYYLPIGSQWFPMDPTDRTTDYAVVQLFRIAQKEHFPIDFQWITGNCSTNMFFCRRLRRLAGVVSDSLVAHPLARSLACLLACLQGLLAWDQRRGGILLPGSSPGTPAEV